MWNELQLISKILTLNCQHCLHQSQQFKIFSHLAWIQFKHSKIFCLQLGCSMLHNIKKKHKFITKLALQTILICHSPWGGKLTWMLISYASPWQLENGILIAWATWIKADNLNSAQLLLVDFHFHPLSLLGIASFGQTWRSAHRW
jgi:hypothetical protein